MKFCNEYPGIQETSPTNPENNTKMLRRRWQSSSSSVAVAATSSQKVLLTINATDNDNNNALLQELFCEACSSLYNDILNATDHQSVINENDIIRRRMEIIEQGTELSNALPQLSNLITSKEIARFLLHFSGNKSSKLCREFLIQIFDRISLSTINRAMEHLKLSWRSSLDNAGNAAKEEGESTALSELRKWLQIMGEKLSLMEAKFTRDVLARKELDRLAADQQILQLQIETEGHNLVNNVRRTITRNSEENERGVDRWIQRRQRHLKTLTKRWYHLWIRSLSVQCRIERQLDYLYSSDDDSESDPELREPQVKRRRVISSGSDKGIKEYNELIRGDEEDIIPFAEEEYESIDCNTMSLTKKEHFWNNEEGLKLYDSTCSTAIMSGCSKSDHSDVENSWNANSNNLQGVNSRVTWLPPADVDEQRRYRIHYSPVKSFYKTVPLDEAGATDTEMSRISMSGWPDGSLSYLTDMHALTDSLIVNAEDEPEMDSSDDIKEILSMLNDDENGNPEWESFEQQGTQWREFKYGKTRYQLSFKRNWLLDCVDNDDKHSCDASSEESDDLPTDLTPVTETKVSTPSVLDLRQCSLKRRRRGRFSTSDRLPSMMKMSSSALGQDLEDSVCSQTWSDVPHLNGAVASLGSVRLPPSHSLGTAFYGRHQVRRKLRARRLPRSMSDGEHLGMCMDTSTHSAPGASHWCVTGCRDSDTTGPDQSDAPPYEWDDYKPPAKTEDEWDDEDGREDISVLTIEDDFHMQLGSFHSSFPGHLYASNQLPFSTNEKETPVRKKTARPVATIVGKCVPRHPDFCGTDKRKLKLVKTRTIPLTSSKLNFSKLRYLSESDLGNIFTINNGNTNSSTECIQSFPFSSLPQQSPLPTILSKIEKFASSLKLIHDDDSGLDSSLSTLSSIRSLGDVVSTLKIFNDIHERLLEEQEELQSLLSSDSFSGDFSGLLGEFEPLCRGYEEAVKRVEQFMAQIEAIRDKWNDWAETQQIIQTMIRTIESDLSELRKGTDNSEQICSELELCQERMSRLETACNYLSCNLASLHQRSSTQPPTIDFTSQLALYSNALIQLKTRFEKEMGHAKSVDKATLVRSRKRVHLKDAVNATTRLEVDSHVSSAHSSWSFKALFIITVMAAFAAWFSTTSLVPWRTTLGPHLDYINGPPPL